MSASATATLEVRRVYGGKITSLSDVVTTEEPMEIRVLHGGRGKRRSHSIAVTMRTPGNDFELAAGFLVAEGIVRERHDIDRIAYCIEPGTEDDQNIVNVYLRAGVEFQPELLARHFYTTSSCGVCGKASLEALRALGCPAIAPGTATVRHEVVRRLPGLLRESQSVFEQTGGLHAAGLFDTEGGLLGAWEDVGRHNAMDKLTGHHLLTGALPLSGAAVVFSGRASWELMQKALVAGIPIAVAVGAPSSLAVDLAREFGMTLVGFARGDGFNIYAGAERVLGPGP